jgi:hypothetical protein
MKCIQYLDNIPYHGYCLTTIHTDLPNPSCLLTF